MGYQPEGDVVVTKWAAHTRGLAVKIDQRYVERMLGEALHGTGSSTRFFAPTIDLTAGAGRSWMSLLRTLMAQLGDPECVLHAPTTAMPFAGTDAKRAGRVTGAPL